MEQQTIDVGYSIPDPQHFEPEKVASPQIHLHNITHTVQPSIMQCSMGGFLISVPGRGVAARSTFEEAMQFLSEEVHKECYGQGRDLPKIVRDTYESQSLVVQCAIALGVVVSGFGSFAALLRVLA